jgi:hypothetical protein
MYSAEEIISQELERQRLGELVDTWRQICALHDEGGPGLVESYFAKKLRDIRSKFTQEVKEIETGRSVFRTGKGRKRRR